MPAAVGGDLELEAENPKTGSSLKWTVRAGGYLNASLQSHEAFFLRYEVDDFAAAGPDEN